MTGGKKNANVDPDDKLKACLRKILKKRFQAMVSFEQKVAAGNKSEALHDMRVAGRRVQTLLKVFRNCFPQQSFKPQYAVVRTLITSLGRVRECDVFIEMLTTSIKPMHGVKRKTLRILCDRFNEQRTNELQELRWTLRLLSQIRYQRNFRQFLKSSS